MPLQYATHEVTIRNRALDVLLVAPRGFCAGVRMAVDCLDQVVATRPGPIYAFHEIVHNTSIVESFQRRGVVFVEDIELIPSGATVVLSAHGVAPEIYSRARARNLSLVDATCPLVMKVHLEARRFQKEGYSIVLVGHRGHDEVVGIQGEAEHAIQIAESVAEVETLNVPDPSKVAVLTQTTLSLDETKAIIAALRRRFPLLRLPHKDDVCYATQNRQEALRAALPESDLALVIGSRSSSNTQRLKELASEYGVCSYLIDGPAEIKLDWFREAHSVLVTAGASVPERLVTEVMRWLSQRFHLHIEQRILKTEAVSFLLPLSALAAPRPTTNCIP
jgi:4-hydroxy-3-methylbut-2-en-1-yl diphosphate reductase